MVTCSGFLAEWPALSEYLEKKRVFQHQGPIFSSKIGCLCYTAIIIRDEFVIHKR